MTTSDPAPSLLGGERGLDHVGIAVKDLDVATHTYRDLLGFNRPEEGTLPNGIHNTNYYFGDSTYLETMVPWDRDKAAWLASFLDQHEGAAFGVLAARSPDSTGAFLTARGITIGKPFSGTIRTAGDDAMPAEKWQTFFLPNGTLAGDPFYFISYVRKDRDPFLKKLEDPRIRRQFHHKNTALGVSAVWVAVPDLADQTKAYESIGLAKRAPFEDPFLDAHGQRFAAGTGEIWLLSSRSPDGPVAKFLRDRGKGAIMGLSIAVGSVAVASEVITERAHLSLTTASGLLGQSFRVPPEVAHGVWLEFAQK